MEGLKWKPSPRNIAPPVGAPEWESRAGPSGAARSAPGISQRLARERILLPQRAHRHASAAGDSARLRIIATCIATRRAICRLFAAPRSRWPRDEKRREPALFIELLSGGPNGVRTRVSALRGPCPRPLDDGAGRASTARLLALRSSYTERCGNEKWLGEEGSNPHYQGQNLASYH